MGFKRILNGFLYGVSVTLGCIAAQRGWEAMSDPYERAKIKKKVKNIKNALTEKEES